MTSTSKGVTPTMRAKYRSSTSSTASSMNNSPAVRQPLTNGSSGDGNANDNGDSHILTMTMTMTTTGAETRTGGSMPRVNNIAQQFSDLHIQQQQQQQQQKIQHATPSSLTMRQQSSSRLREQWVQQRMAAGNDSSGLAVRGTGNGNGNGNVPQAELTQSPTVSSGGKKRRPFHQRGTIAPAPTATSSFDDRAHSHQNGHTQHAHQMVFSRDMSTSSPYSTTMGSRSSATSATVGSSTSTSSDYQQRQQQQYPYTQARDGSQVPGGVTMSTSTSTSASSVSIYGKSSHPIESYEKYGRQTISSTSNINGSDNSNSNNNNSSSSSNNVTTTTLPNRIPPNSQTTTFSADGKVRTLVFSTEKAVGKGSFGEVFLARIFETNEVVAIKKVLQDRRFKNRELQIMKSLNHQCVVHLKHHFYTKQRSSNSSSSRRSALSSSSRKLQPIDPSTATENDDLYLNIVMEYVPDTVFRFLCQYTRKNDFMPMIYVKLFTYQMCRALNYIHTNNICHRDIKPQNLLIDPVKGILKLCDFGSAKQLQPNEPNVSYICSRYYRAPELIFGATNYTTAIDIWSIGCVFGEMLIGQPLFAGESSVDQLVEIIRVLGTPTRQEVETMNKNYTEFKFPQVKPHSWAKVFSVQKHQPVPPEAIDLIQKFLQYNPKKRILPLDALAHPFFDELRDPRTRLPNGRPLPPLFDLSRDELKMLSDPLLKSNIIPKRFLSGLDLEKANDTSMFNMITSSTPPPTVVTSSTSTSTSTAAPSENRGASGSYGYY